MTNDLRCRACGTSNDAHTDAKLLLHVPHDGDFSLCAYCGAWSIFDGGALREPTPDEATLIARDPDCIHAAHVCEVVRRFARKGS